MPRIPFDRRCPTCNKPVIGTEEIAYRLPKQIPTKCQHCQTSVLMVKDESTVPVRYYFDFDPDNNFSTPSNVVSVETVATFLGRALMACSYFALPPHLKGKSKLFMYALDEYYSESMHQGWDGFTENSTPLDLLEDFKLYIGAVDYYSSIATPEAMQALSKNWNELDKLFAPDDEEEIAKEPPTKREAMLEEVHHLEHGVGAMSMSHEQIKRHKELCRLLNLCKCRMCGKEYDERKARGNYKGFCSAKCEHAKAKALGYKKGAENKVLGKSEYSVLRDAGEVGCVYVNK